MLGFVVPKPFVATGTVFLGTTSLNSPCFSQQAWSFPRLHSSSIAAFFVFLVVGGLSSALSVAAYSPGNVQCLLAGKERDNSTGYV